MERVHYRRVSPSRNISGGYSPTARNYHEQETEITPGETIIMQCIVSGVIMVCVLLISLVDIAPTLTLRDGLRQALAGATTVDELVTEIQSLEWLEFGTTESPATEPVFHENEIQESVQPNLKLPYDTGTLLPMPPATSPEYYFPITIDYESSTPP